jgi:hypothetical protein
VTPFRTLVRYGFVGWLTLGAWYAATQQPATAPTSTAALIADTFAFVVRIWPWVLAGPVRIALCVLGFVWAIRTVASLPLRRAAGGMSA